MRKDFTNINIESSEETLTESSENVLNSPEQIPIKNRYIKTDLADVTHLNYVAGLPPFLRGPYSTMYISRPWTIRQYAGLLHSI